VVFDLRSYVTLAASHVLGLMDRDPASPTYGCFDRAYWHYRVKAFTNGAAQAYVQVLAQLWAGSDLDLPFSRSEVVKEWVFAGIRFSIQAMHKSGACDEHYFGEHSLVARTFALEAALRSLALLDALGEEFRAGLEKQAAWLAGASEDAVIGNHLAGQAYALLLFSEKYGGARYSHAAYMILDRLLEHQHEEGWFPEYFGCDLGYSTKTLDYLVKILALTPTNHSSWEPLRDALLKNLEFLLQWVTPAGHFPPFFGSRYTHHFFGAGFFSLLTGDLPLSGTQKKQVQALCASLGSNFAQIHERLLDDQYLFFQLNDVLETYAALAQPAKPAANRGPTKVVHSPGAGFLCIPGPDGRSHAYFATQSGGGLAIYNGSELVYWDTGIQLVTEESVYLSMGGPVREAGVASDNAGFCYGNFIEKTYEVMTPGKQGALDWVGALAARIPPLSRWLKKALVRRTVTQRKITPWSYTRVIREDGGQFVIETRLGDSSPAGAHVFLARGVLPGYLPSGNFWAPHLLVAPTSVGVVRNLPWDGSARVFKQALFSGDLLTD
jgi:hypothetical protein